MIRIHIRNPPLGLCIFFTPLGPNHLEIKAKIRGFDRQKYLYKISVSLGPRNFQKVGSQKLLPLLQRKFVTKWYDFS